MLYSLALLSALLVGEPEDTRFEIRLYTPGLTIWWSDNEPKVLDSGALDFYDENGRHVIINGTWTVEDPLTWRQRRYLGKEM